MAVGQGVRPTAAPWSSCFPKVADRSWGPGSRLVLRTAVEQGKLEFVTSATEPYAPASAQIEPGRLYGIVSGWWVVSDALRAKVSCDVGA